MNRNRPDQHRSRAVHHVRSRVNAQSQNEVHVGPSWLNAKRELRLGRTRWTVPAVTLVGAAFLLTVVGLTFVASASSISSLHATGNSWTVFHRQVFWVAIGTVVMAVSALVPYRAWWTFGLPLYAFAVGSTLLTLTGLGSRVNGSSRWIGTGNVGFQPSEVLKLATIVMLAGMFANQRDRATMSSGHFLFRRLGPILGLAVGPVLLQPDMGTSVVILLAAVAIIVAAGMPGRRLAEFGVGGTGLAFLYAYSSSYRRDRLTAFLHPADDVTGTGWHVAQSKIGFASGRLLGVGIGASRSKWGFVPNAHTDFVFAIIGEELGLVGATIVLALFGVIAIVGLSVVNQARDRFGSLMAVGIVTWIVAQAFINMSAVLGTLPVTGIPMPFVSYGGSSFIVVALAFGLLINIARSAEAAPARERARRRSAARDAIATPA